MEAALWREVALTGGGDPCGISPAAKRRSISATSAGNSCVSIITLGLVRARADLQAVWVQPGLALVTSHTGNST